MLQKEAWQAHERYLFLISINYRVDIDISIGLISEIGPWSKYENMSKDSTQIKFISAFGHAPLRCCKLIKTEIHI